MDRPKTVTLLQTYDTSTNREGFDDEEPTIDMPPLNGDEVLTELIYEFLVSNRPTKTISPLKKIL